MALGFNLTPDHFKKFLVSGIALLLASCLKAIDPQ